MEKSLSLHELAEALTGNLDFFFYGYGLPMVFGAQLAQQRIKKVLGNDLEQVKEHFLSLGTALPGNKTSEMGAMMAALAASGEISRYDSADVFLQDMAAGELSPAFVQRWEAFIAEFGARCPREIDPATARVNENPALLFDQLKRMASADGTGHIFEEAKQKREAAYERLYQLALGKGKKQAAALERAYRTWVTLGGYRETPKHYVIWVVNLFRKRVLEVADSLMQAGRLDDREQIFDLTIEDIDRGMADANLDLRVIAAERMVLISKIKCSKYVARVLDSRGKIFFPPRKAAREGELAGVPISSGVVQGRVKVLRSADEKELLPGEILVTRATDPRLDTAIHQCGRGGAGNRWCPAARGGGCQEYGLPCVSGITQATELFKDGQLIEVDGSNGIIRVLEGEIPVIEQRQVPGTELSPKAAARREKAQAKRKLIEKLMRIIPVLLLPLVVLAGFVIVFVESNC
jgi:phosphohistidine swiveling domain-containing protein